MTRKWNGYWINTGKTMGAPSPTVGAAPYLRKTFQCEKAPSEAKISGTGPRRHAVRSP